MLAGNATISTSGQAEQPYSGIHLGETSGQLDLSGNTLTLTSNSSNNGAWYYFNNSSYFKDSSTGQTGALNLGPNCYFVSFGPNTLAWTGSLILSGGTLADSNSHGWNLSNPITLAAGTLSTFYLGNNDYDLHGSLTGSGTVQKAGALASWSVHLMGNNSGFTGTYADNSSSTNGTWLDSANAGSAGQRGY